MNNFIIHQKHHYGWTKSEHNTKNLDDAVENDILKYHDFLNEFKGKYSIEHTVGKEDYPSYTVKWDDDEPHQMIGGSLVKGEYWFSDRLELGKSDDCAYCGGTGSNHYNPFVQCFECGDGKTEGKSSGKNNQQKTKR